MGFGNGVPKNLLALSTILDKIAQTVNHRTEFSLGQFHFSEAITLSCLQIATMEQHDWKKILLEPLITRAIRCCH